MRNQLQGPWRQIPGASGRHAAQSLNVAVKHGGQVLPRAIHSAVALRRGGQQFLGSDSNRTAKRPKGCPTGGSFWTLTPITAGSTWGSALRVIGKLKAKPHWWRCEWRRLQQPVSRRRNRCQQTDQVARPVFSCLCKAPASWETNLALGGL